MTPTQNPNWPLSDIAVSFLSGPGDPTPVPYWCSMKARSMDQITTNRGRQYELDQIQTGTWSGTLENTDSALDPSNTSSPFYPQLKPYRAFRHRMQYPPTVNLLTADQSNAGYTSGLPLGTLPPLVTKLAAGAMTLTTAAASGTNEYLLGYTASNAANGGLYMQGFTVTPGAAHSAQCRIHASANNGLNMQIWIQWINSAGGTISTSTGPNLTATTVNQTATLTATAPANAVGAILVILSVNTVANATNIFVANVQLELASSPSTYVLPNKWYSIFNGFVERWPQSWKANGQFGMSNPTVVDAFGYLSQRKLLSSVYHELKALGPQFLYPLDEASGSSLYYDLTANNPPAQFVASNGGSISKQAAPGTGLATSSKGTLPQGEGGPVLHIDNQSVSNNGVIALVPPVDDSVLSSGNGFTRLFFFRPTGNSWQNPAPIWYIQQDLAVNNYIQIYAWGSSIMYFSISVYRNGSLTYGGTVQVPFGTTTGDGAWHMFALTCSADGKTWHQYQDGVSIESQTLASDGRPQNLKIDQFGAFAPLQEGGWLGDMACLTGFTYELTAAQIASIWSTFKYGGSGNGSATSASRYSDILRWSNWAGASAIDNNTSGQTVAYGPATEMNASSDSSGTDTVSMLQTVVDTEAGVHYVAADGTITFKARRARYNQGTPTVVLGENTGAGEIPYTMVQTGYDVTRVANDISVVQTQTGATQRAVDNNSVPFFGDIQLQRTVNTLNPYEQSDAAQYLLIRNSQPVQRIEGISVNVGANPTSAVWTAMLGLEIGTRVRLMRRPPLGAATLQVDGFVEQVNWTIDNKGNASVDLQISVNNSQQYWQLDSSTYSVLGSTTVIGY